MAGFTSSGFTSSGFVTEVGNGFGQNYGSNYATTGGGSGSADGSQFRFPNYSLVTPPQFAGGHHHFGQIAEASALLPGLTCGIIESLVVPPMMENWQGPRLAAPIVIEGVTLSEQEAPLTVRAGRMADAIGALISDRPVKFKAVEGSVIIEGAKLGMVESLLRPIRELLNEIMGLFGMAEVATMDDE